MPRPPTGDVHRQRAFGPGVVQHHHPPRVGIDQAQLTGKLLQAVRTAQPRFVELDQRFLAGQSGAIGGERVDPVAGHYLERPRHEEQHQQPGHRNALQPRLPCPPARGRVRFAGQALVVDLLGEEVDVLGRKRAADGIGSARSSRSRPRPARPAWPAGPSS